jgi:predicted nucleotidyltransferase/HEPN domain-containing protein
MRADLEHLPQSTQRELEHVVRILMEEFAAKTRPATAKWSKLGRILKVVLYGSFARGDWIVDRVGGYVSDYDLLIVVNDDRLTDFEFWSAAEDRLVRDVTVSADLTAPVSFIVHTLTDVNAQLERGLPFFVDIVGQGIALYEAEGFPFAQPRLLAPEAALAEAGKRFQEWFPSALRRAELAREALAKGYLNEAAFDFHQTAERLYHCLLLTLTLYSPKSHRLRFLRAQCEQLAPAVAEAWPRSEKVQRRCFELLREAYVNARYSPHYSITSSELTWISERIAVLEELVREVCQARLAGP